MHVCTCVPSYLPHVGGAEVGMHTILRHLAATTEHRFSVITATLHPDLPDYEVMDGVEVYRYRCPKVWARWLVPTLYGFLHTGRLIRFLQPDLIHISYIMPSGLSAWVAAQRLHLPVVMSLGGNDIYDPFYMPPRLFQRLSAYCIQRTPSIVAYSSVVRQRLITHFGAPPAAVQRVGFCVDIERFRPGLDGQPIRRRYGIRLDQTVIFALQRLERRKGVGVLLTALKHVIEHFPDVRVLIGGKGQDAEMLRSLCDEMDMQRAVMFCGFIPEHEKPLYYAAADLFALHSYYEGLGIVLAEASAAGLPVVTTRAGGTVDIIQDGINGLLVEPGDVAVLSEALSSLVADPEKRQAMGQAGHQHTVENFGISAVTSAYLKIFEQTQSEQTACKE
jgi:glycosyltransferase involved in cell wall biosynthesis